MPSNADGASSLATAEVKRVKRRFSLVWLIPIVAAIAGAYLVWVTLSQRGPSITITFQAASGIEPGKTPIKYRDVQLGVVDTVRLSEDLQHVIVTAKMSKEAEHELRTGTQFWVESARISASGVSGLGTLLSGSYIIMRPGDGEPERNFIGLDTPPVYQVDLPGKHFTLQADSLGSVSPGAPIYFRGIQVGSILGYQLQDAGGDVDIFAFVAAPYDAFVREDSRFWNASGIDVSAGVNGVNIRTESLQSIIAGGVAFDTTKEAGASALAADGAHFKLFASYDAVQQAKYTVRVPFKLYFQTAVDGLDVGAPVIAYGIKLGEVTSVRLEIDPETMKIRIPVTIALEPQRWTNDYSKTPSVELVNQRMGKWVERGLRAQLQSGSLITGQKIINLGLFPSAAPASLTYEDGMAVLPTVPSEIEVLTEKANAFLNKLEKAPIAELVSDLRTTVQNTDKLIASTSVRQGVSDVAPLLQSLKQTSEEARAMLQQATSAMQSANSAIGDDSALRYDLARMIKELSGAARSLRGLADFLQNNPNALIVGKPLPEQP